MRQQACPSAERSAFTVGLLNALHTYKPAYVSSLQIAEEACQIEIDVLKQPIGRQDQLLVRARAPLQAKPERCGTEG